jgi:hypothetical protein
MKQVGIDDSWKLDFATALLQDLDRIGLNCCLFLKGLSKAWCLRCVGVLLVSDVRVSKAVHNQSSCTKVPESICTCWVSKSLQTADCRLPWLERPVISGIGQLHMCVQPR